MTETKQPPIKVVISGPVGSGKTTLIRTVSSTEVVNTDELASEEIGKELTTVAMDFGILQLGDQDIYLFGTPGQERFDFMWEVLSEGCLGLILLIPADKPGEMAKVRRIFDVITSVVDVPVLLVLTRSDLGQVWEKEDVRDYFEIPEAAIVQMDPRDQNQALDALILLVEMFLATTEEMEEAPMEGAP